VKIEDITVEVRYPNLTRAGQVPDYNLVGATFISRFNNVGSWSLRMPFGDPLVELLRTPGFGIVVTGPDDKVLISGPTLAAKLVQSASDVRGEWLIEGSDDSIVLAERLAYPEPSIGDVTAQTVSHDRRTGTSELVMKGYVNDNIADPGNGRDVPGLVVAPNLDRGGLVNSSARFTELQTLLYGIAESVNLGYDVKQVDDNLVFDVYQPVDRSAFVRMDIENQQLSSAEYGYTAPKATRAIVAGQGTDVERLFIERSNTESIDAETLWARRIEVFEDSRSSEDVAELEQAGDEKLAEDGRTIVSLSVTPTNDLRMSYPADWGLGDVVAVVAGQIETQAVVTEVGVSIGVDGVRVAAVVGSPVAVDFESSLISRSNSQERRISNLERNELSGGGPAADNFRGQCGVITDRVVAGTTLGVYRTTGITADFDADISFNTTLGTADRFGIKNTSGATVLARVYASADCTSANNQTLGVKLAYNGVAIDESECRAFTGAANQEAKLVTSWIIEMEPDAEVSIFIANHSGTQAITVKRARVVVSGVVGQGPRGPQGIQGEVGPVGPIGLQGEQGIPGEAATVDVGVTTVVTPDSDPLVTNSGSSSDAVLDFDLPRAPDVSVGSVVTGDPGSTVTVTDTGVDGDVVLNFSIPKGEPGTLEGLTVVDPIAYDDTTGTLFWDRPLGEVSSLATACSFQTWGFLVDGKRIYTRGNSSTESGTATTATENPARVPFPRETGQLVDYQVGPSSYALFDNGNLWVWGENASGQLGLGNTTAQPNPVLTMAEVVAVWFPKNQGMHDRRVSNTFIKMSNGNYLCAGNNLNGVLGIGNTTNQTSWVLATGMNNLEAISPIRRIDSFGGSISAMVFTELENGSVYAQGTGTHGALGTGTTTLANSVPVDVTANWGGSGYRTLQVICGVGYRSGTTNSQSNDTMMLREVIATGERRIFTAGEGNWGLHGDGTLTDRSIPTIVPTIGTDILKVARIGGTVSANFAVMSDGKLWAWGRNSRGQLGVGNTVQQNSPVLAATDAADLLTELSDSELTPFETACFYKDNQGFIKGCGLNTSGQIGDGTILQRNTWVDVRLPSEADVIAIGILGYGVDRFTVFLTSRGRIYGTGYNGRKDLYDWTTTNVLVPFLLTLPNV
jgi:alpha-tubulin suppressor-like RCC1 family protein